MLVGLSLATIPASLMLLFDDRRTLGQEAEGLLKVCVDYINFTQCIRVCMSKIVFVYACVRSCVYVYMVISGSNRPCLNCALCRDSLTLDQEAEGLVK
jgi:hypothetical protein